MGAGASEAGDDAVVGRINSSNKRTIITGSERDDDEDFTPYQEDFVLEVSIEDGRLFSTGHELDAIHATGTVEFVTDDGKPVPAGNGVVGRGLNGVVGYDQNMPRDTALERQPKAGVKGIGKEAGVHGIGENAGVRGEARNGEGVHGLGSPGVLGQGVSPGPGIGALGVFGTGETGVHGEGTSGVGVYGVSTTEEGQGGSFSSHRRAQVWLVPLQDGTTDPTQLARGEAGELLVLEDVEERGITVASLWFCTRSGGPGTNPPNWTKIA